MDQKIEPPAEPTLGLTHLKIIDKNIDYPNLRSRVRLVYNQKFVYKKKEKPKKSDKKEPFKPVLENKQKTIEKKIEIKDKPIIKVKSENQKPVDTVSDKSRGVSVERKPDIKK